MPAHCYLMLRTGMKLPQGLWLKYKLKIFINHKVAVRMVSNIFPPLCLQVSFIVDYSINTNNARSGIDKIVGLVQKGIWKATLIQQDHPKSKITINV